MQGIGGIGLVLVTVASLVGCGQADERAGMETLQVGVAGTGGGDCPTLLMPSPDMFQNGTPLAAGGPPYTGATDTVLEQAVPTTNEGALGYVVVKGGGNKRHGIMRWDLSSLPQNTFVKRACLALWVLDPSAAEYQAFELLRDWSEAQATWNVAATGINWQTPGAWGPADGAASVVARTPANTRDRISISLPTALVQHWVSHPEQNRGIIFGNDSSNDGVSFGSSQGEPAQAPALLIQR